MSFIRDIILSLAFLAPTTTVANAASSLCLNGTLTASSGVMDDGTPVGQNYANRLFCERLIVAPAGQCIVATITRLESESAFDFSSQSTITTLSGTKTQRPSRSATPSCSGTESETTTTVPHFVYAPGLPLWVYLTIGSLAILLILAGMAYGWLYHLYGTSGSSQRTKKPVPLPSRRLEIRPFRRRRCITLQRAADYQATDTATPSFRVADPTGGRQVGHRWRSARPETRFHPSAAPPAAAAPQPTSDVLTMSCRFDEKSPPEEDRSTGSLENTSATSSASNAHSEDEMIGPRSIHQTAAPSQSLALNHPPTITTDPTTSSVIADPNFDQNNNLIGSRPPFTINTNFGLLKIEDGAMPVGQGAFGSVYRGFSRCGVLLAVKVIRLPSQLARDKTKNEVEKLQKLRHKNVVGYCPQSCAQ